MPKNQRERIVLSKLLSYTEVYTHIMIQLRYRFRWIDTQRVSSELLWSMNGKEDFPAAEPQ